MSMLRGVMYSPMQRRAALVANAAQLADAPPDARKKGTRQVERAQQCDKSQVVTQELQIEPGERRWQEVRMPARHDLNPPTSLLTSRRVLAGKKKSLAEELADLANPAPKGERTQRHAAAVHGHRELKRALEQQEQGSRTGRRDVAAHVCMQLCTGENAGLQS